MSVDAVFSSPSPAVLLLPSRPLAGRVDRVNEVNAGGVGGLRSLGICGGGPPP
jgi:hypothetical protein